jgi:ribose 5-phosphate isomerase
MSDSEVEAVEADRVTRSKVAYALQKAGEQLARRRSSRASGAMVTEDGNSIVVSFYSAGSAPEPSRERRRIDRYRQALVRRGFSVTTIPDEPSLRVL